MQIDLEGGLYYADSFELPVTSQAETSPSIAEAALPVSPFPDSLKFHSRPGAVNVLYLDFDGEDVTGTQWNTDLARTVIPAVPFSTDTDFSTYSDTEQAAIKRVWERVAEDYAPFNIDVTTERPATFTTRTAHALITRNTDANGAANPSSSAGGVGYVNVFGSSSYSKYRPVWIYFNNLANDESYIGEASSHEIGHNLGLSHDGKTDGTAYYGGHGTGDISWGTLMGTGYNRNVSQWCKGDYYLANNTEDDLAIIAGKVSYRADDHGNTFATATALAVENGTNITSTTPETDPLDASIANKGVIERNTDVDVFSFVTGNGLVNLSVKPWIMPSGTKTRGGNLDILVELYNEAGVLLATNNPATTTYATIQTNLTSGLYYLRLSGTGAGDPFSSTPTGYTAYASLGQYFISGTVTTSTYVIPPQAQLLASDITQTGTGAKQFTVTYSDNVAINVATLSDANIRVTGPAGYDRAARFVSLDVAGNGTPRVATYQVDPPSATTWTLADNGTYTVWMQTNQVADTEGAYVVAGSLGQFTVNIARVIFAEPFDSDPGWTLDGLWQYGPPAYTSGGPTAGFTGANILGYNLAGTYENRLSTALYATTKPINCSGATALTFRFYRWLGLRSGDLASIQVSTNGASWVDVWTTTSTVSDSTWTQVQYALPDWVNNSPTVQLRWGLDSNASQNDIGWNLDDVAIVAGGAVDTAAPIPSLSVTDITTAGPPNQPMAVTYTDDTAIKVASLGAADLLVTGPNGFSNLVSFVSVDTPTDGTPRTATYSLPAPGGSWTAAANGAYQVKLLAGEVTDTSNNSIPETLLGGFNVNIAVVPQALAVDRVSLSVVEGSNATFTVRLAQPTSVPVTVSVTRVSGDPDLVIQSGATLVFGPDNWSNAAPVTIAALPDADLVAGTAIFECTAPGLQTVTVQATEINTTPAFTLTATATPAAWGTVTPAQGNFAAGSTVELLATPAPYYQFDSWSGDAADNANPLLLTITSNVVVTAQFKEILTTNYPTPYWWLASYGYTNDFELVVTNLGANGMPLWQSYTAGLEPTNSTSQLLMEVQTAPAASSWSLNWTPVPGRVYTVLWSANPFDGFTPLPGASDLPSTVTGVTITNSDAPAGFYRLQVTKP